MRIINLHTLQLNHPHAINHPSATPERLTAASQSLISIAKRDACVSDGHSPDQEIKIGSHTTSTITVTHCSQSSTATCIRDRSIEQNHLSTQLDAPELEFVRFLDDIGSIGVSENDPRIASLFANTVTRLNGNSIERTPRSTLLAYMTPSKATDCTQNTSATWNIFEAVIRSSDSNPNSCVVYMAWIHATLGVQTSFATLRIDSDNKIEFVYAPDAPYLARSS